MSLFERLLQAVRSWRRRRGGVRTIRKAGVAMEQLDLRQMLSVTFTGNVAIDFPATQTPGVVVLPDNPSVQHPVIGDPTLQNLVRVSGFDISGLRVTYTPDDGGTLSVGIEQPDSQLRPGPVIAGDADNNGNSGGVNPAVTALGLGVQDPADFGGTEYMGVYLDFLNSGTAQVAAGFPQTVPVGGASKRFTVATAMQPGPNAPPIFVTPLPQHAGNIYTQNDPRHPNMELSIVNFDQLYQTITGTALEPTSVFHVGAFAGSSQDGPISEAFFPAQPVVLSAATPPTPEPPVCPPISPPILINPHEHRIIDTAHRSLVRVYVQGTSGFDPSTIDASTVDLNGAKPIASMPYQMPRSPFPSRTFVFRASDIQAEPGLQMLTFTATTTDGQEIISQNQVVNVPNIGQDRGRLGFLANRGSRVDSQYNALRRLAATNPEAILDPGAVPGGSPTTVNLGVASPSAAPGLSVDYSTRTGPADAVAPISPPREVVTIPRNQNQAGAKLNERLNRTLEQYLAEAAAAEEVDDASPTPVASGAY